MSKTFKHVGIGLNTCRPICVGEVAIGSSYILRQFFEVFLHAEDITKILLIHSALDIQSQISDIAIKSALVSSKTVVPKSKSGIRNFAGSK